MSQYVSRKVSAISLLAIICVIIQHCYIFGGLHTVDVFGVKLNLYGLVWYGILDWPVSFFFLVSGFNLMKHCSEKHWYVEAIGKRTHSLLIPYLIFCVIGIAITGNWAWNDVASNLGVTSLLPVVPPLWYVRTLFVLCLLSPVILWAMRLSFKFNLICLLTVFLFLVLMDVPAKRAVFLSLFYFTIGIFIAVHGVKLATVRFRMILMNGLMPILVAVLICAGMDVHLSFGDAEWYRFVLIPICLFLIWFGYDLAYKVFLGRMVWLKRCALLLSKRTFFVYCVHGVFLLALEVVKFTNPFGRWGWLIMSFILSALSFMIAFIIQQALPRMYLILSGGR